MGLVYTVVLSLFAYFFQEDHKVLQPIAQKQDKSVYAVLKDPELNKNPEGKAVLGVYRLILCSFSGQACTDNPADDKANFAHSMFGKTTAIMMSPYMRPPASGSMWLQESLANAGFIPKAYAAQGLGYASISPFSTIWKVFRDVAYILMVLVVISLGFLIMFRAKLDPQAVISIENSLPRIVIALILVTFSFAIAGFLIDLMYVLIGLCVSMLAPLVPDETETHLLNRFMYANVGDIADSFNGGKSIMWKSVPGVNIFSYLSDTARIGNALMGIFPDWLNTVVKVIAAFFLYSTAYGQVNGTFGLEGWGKILNGWTFLGVGLGDMSEGFLTTSIKLITYAILFPMLLFYGAGFILGILILFSIIFLMFRIFFMLFFGYLRILLYIIFAPFLLMFEAIPGRGTFTWWLQNLVGELIMFPTVVVILLVGRIINNLTVSHGAAWQPPFLWGLNADNFAVLVGTGIMFLIPDLVQIVKETVGAKGIPIKFGIDTYFSGAEAIGNVGKNAIFQVGSARQVMPGVERLIQSSPLGKIPLVQKAFSATGVPPQPAGDVPSPDS